MRTPTPLAIFLALLLAAPLPAALATGDPGTEATEPPRRTTLYDEEVMPFCCGDYLRVDAEYTQVWLNVTCEHHFALAIYRLVYHAYQVDWRDPAASTLPSGALEPVATATCMEGTTNQALPDLHPTGSYPYYSVYHLEFVNEQGVAIFTGEGSAHVRISGVKIEEKR